MRELAREEFSGLKTQVEAVREQLEVLLLPQDPDEKDVVMEIRAGVGGGRRRPCLLTPCAGCKPCTPPPRGWL